MEDDELKVLMLLDIPRTKGEIYEATGLEDSRLSTILQKLKRNYLAQLIEGKRWEITELGGKKLDEIAEEPKPLSKESLKEEFKIHRKRRDLLNRCEELSSTFNWVWEENLRKDLESMEEDVSFIKKHLNEASSMEELEELEGLLEDLDRSWDKLFIRNEELSWKKVKMERERKLSQIREYYLTEYSDLTNDELEGLIKMCENDPEHLKEIYQQTERQEHLENLLDQAIEYGINRRFIQDVHSMATPEKLGLEYLLKLWEDYNHLAARYGPSDAYRFLRDQGPSIIKRGGDLWQAFHRYMVPPRRADPFY